MSLYYGQRRESGGTVNYLDVAHPTFEAFPVSGVRVDFQHVGSSSSPEPVVLDGYIFGFLHLAMESADRLVINGPVSAKAVRNAHLMGEAWHCWVPEKYRPVEIVAESVVDDDALLDIHVQRARRGAAISAFSGGVDATFTALRHAGGQLGPNAFPVEDLLMVHGFDVPLDEEADLHELIERTQPLVDELNVSLRIVRTNIKDVSLQNWPYSFGLQLACVLHQFSAEFQYGLMASSKSYSDLLVPWGSYPGTDHLLSGGDFEIIHDGAGYSRTEKVASIADNATARRSVKVCWQGERAGRNCGHCEKCIRTRLNFLAVGTENPECFDDRFELNEIATIDAAKASQLTELVSILEYAEQHQLSDEWVTVLRARTEAIEAVLHGNDKPTKGNGQAPGPATVGPHSPFTDRLCLQQGVFAEFFQRQQSVWLLTEMPGNTGDRLIAKGTERLLALIGASPVPISVAELSAGARRKAPGTLVIPGSGALTAQWHEWLPELVLVAAGAFDKVVILPSEFEPTVPEVANALSEPNVYAFARDPESYRKIKSFGRAAINLDLALWAMDFAPATANERADDQLGDVLLAMRTDAGSLLMGQGLQPAPVNDDISLTKGTLEEFLECIGQVDTVVTDRLHVAVSAVMLGAHVRFVDPVERKISRYVSFNFGHEFASRLQQRDESWLVGMGLANRLGESW